MIKPSVRFIHSADLHLDSPYKGLNHLPETILKDIQESTLTAYQRLVQLAIDEQVDFILLVGDLFDQESSSIKSSLILNKGFERLSEHGIEVYLSYGNHDYMMTNHINLSFPSNVHVFPQKQYSHTIYKKDGQPVAEIGGFSYHNRAVKDRMIDQYVFQNPQLIHIATLHGSLQSNIDHDQYAPFLIDDLKRPDVDYWALGHIHKREVLLKDPYAVYPGNIQGRHMKETGDKGCYLVQLDKQQSHLDFKPLQEVKFINNEINLKGINQLSELYEKIEKYKHELRNEKIFLRLTIRFDETSDVSWSKQQEEELINMLNEEEEEEATWIWIEQLQLIEPIHLNRDEMKHTNPFIKEILDTIDETKNVEPYIEDLLNHRTFKKHLNWDLNGQQMEIKTEAEKFIIEQLFRNG